MKLSIPNEINPNFSGTLLVSFPQIGSSEAYDGGYRSDHIANLRGIRVATINRPIPKRRIIDLGGHGVESDTDDYIQLVRRTGDFAMQQAIDELGFVPDVIYSGNSIGATAALVMTEADPTETTTGVIALDPVGQVAIGHTDGMKRYFNQFKIDGEKSTEQLQTESMGMAPYRTPAGKLVPRLLREFWGHWNISNKPISEQLIKRILLGSKAVDVVVTLAERSPIATNQEQNLFIETLNGYADWHKSQTGAYVDISVAPGTFHSSTDKPLYFIKALDSITGHRTEAN